jgi:hypothetical protein
VSGWASIGTQDIKVRLEGLLATANFTIGGVANATTKSFSLPYAMANEDFTCFGMAQGMDGTGYRTLPVMPYIYGGSSLVYIDKSWGDSTAWDPDGTCWISGTIQYPVGY